MSVIGRRLRQARERLGLSQEKVGQDAELDPGSARVRVNRYENGNRTPNPELVEAFAKVLKVPATYFYAKDDNEAELLLVFHRLSKPKKSKVIEFASSLV